MSAPRVRKLGLRPYIKAALTLQAQKNAYALQEQRQAQIEFDSNIHITSVTSQTETIKTDQTVATTPGTTLLATPSPPSPTTNVAAPVKRVTDSVQGSTALPTKRIPHSKQITNSKIPSNSQPTGVHFDAKVIPISSSPPPLSIDQIKAATNEIVPTSERTLQIVAKVEDDSKELSSSRFTLLTQSKQSIGPSIPKTTILAAVADEDGITIPTQKINDPNDHLNYTTSSQTTPITIRLASEEDDYQATLAELLPEVPPNHKLQKSTVAIETFQTLPLESAGITGITLADTVPIQFPLGNSSYAVPPVTPTSSTVSKKSIIVPYGKGILFTPPNDGTTLSSSKLSSSTIAMSYPAGTVCQRIRVEEGGAVDKVWFETTCMMKDGRWAVIEKILLPSQQPNNTGTNM